ncbi:hypothetical protein [Streptomyces canus]|uniref:hypothetical protein n=1 Tax=Streptomyces canus TaxID=58343 RepID=UPI001319D69A|nr:hypothetical protein [Streptomyces canus]
MDLNRMPVYDVSPVLAVLMRAPVELVPLYAVLALLHYESSGAVFGTCVGDLPLGRWGPAASGVPRYRDDSCRDRPPSRVNERAPGRRVTDKDGELTARVELAEDRFTARTPTSSPNGSSLMPAG